MEPDQEQEANLTRPYVDYKGAASMLCVSPATLRKWCCMRVGPPFIRVGRRVIFSTRDLERWLAKRRVKPAEEFDGHPQRAP